MVIKAQKDRPIKLDAIDKKIFYYLSVNYRIQRKKLAKLIRISPQRLNHRIKQLEKKFLEPFICLNYTLLDITSYIILYEKLNENEIKAISESGSAYYLLQLVGDYQYLAIILTDDIVDFCSKNTPDSSPKIYPLNGYFPDKWNGFDVPVLKEKIKLYKKYKLNPKDYKILFALSEKPDISLLDLSKKLKIGRQTIAKRMKLMEESNIIQAYRFALNVPKIGLLVYFIHLDCKPSEVNKAKSLIQNNKYSGFLFQSYNHLFFPFIVPTHEQLFDFLEEIEKNTDSVVDISQNTGNYVVEPVPKSIKELFQKRSIL
jgi:DNA-binding Lrp family transcriptional regulator